jgi:valyl-tRNA synthetase
VVHSDILSRSPDDIAKHYDAQKAQVQYSQWWTQECFFSANEHPQPHAQSFSIVLPPPNVTGSLHMGHAFNQILQDVIVRYQRMLGKDVVWIPGFDHASIAVHWLLERQLLTQEGKTRHEIGRDNFLKRAHQFKEEVQHKIIQQIQALGSSLDWKRLNFTLDEHHQHAVRQMFVQLHQDGLIYRECTLVNWDPIAQTTVSDLEVVYQENVSSFLWHFAYPLADHSGELIVATTRPETIFGDTAVAVHPDDERYRAYVGKMVRHPLTQKNLPIVADPICVDPQFGTGVVKITPGHDFNDFEVGKRHNLPIVNILTQDGRLNEQAGSFSGLDRVAAREKVVEALDTQGFLRSIEPHTLNLALSERSGAILEPMVSMQWFVRTRPLARPARAAIEHQFTEMLPAVWQNTYFSWMDHIRDWCISRQLWWGHKIPAWHCQHCMHVEVSLDEPAGCPVCKHQSWKEEEDILDTWFSSALWAFSTLGWPQKTTALSRWYPNALLVTGFDIIFFWVARMMMFSQYAMGKPPFQRIFIHPLIRDAQGEKMSKTKGNVVDPILMMETYGADAFRFTLASLGSQTADVRWDPKRAEGYHKFVNKIWQALRFVLNFKHLAPDAECASVKDAPPAVFWFHHELASAVDSLREQLDNLQFGEATQTVYTFIWSIYCDWFIEIAKVHLYDAGTQERDKHVWFHALATGMSSIARMLAPFMPFLAEEIWQHLPPAYREHQTVHLSPFPAAQDYSQNAEATQKMAWLIQVITHIRHMRANYGVPPKDEVQVFVKCLPLYQSVLTQEVTLLLKLAKVRLLETPPKDLEVAQSVWEHTQVMLPLTGVVDVAKERLRLVKESERIALDIAQIKKLLANEGFMKKALPEVVMNKKEQVESLATKHQQLQEAISSMTMV